MAIEAPAEWNYPVWLEYRRLNDPSDKWRHIEIWWRPQVTLEPGNPHTLQAGQSLTEDIQSYVFDHERVAFLKPSNEYEIRLMVRGSGVHPRIYSAPVRVTVTELPEVEQDPVRALQLQVIGVPAPQQPLLALLPEVQSFGVEDATYRQIKQFVGKFPDSIYSVYLRRTVVALSNDETFRPAPPADLAAGYRAYLVKHALWALLDTVAGPLQPVLTLTMRGVTESAMYGVPAIVELNLRNDSGEGVQIPELDDADLENIQWDWMSGRGEMHRVLRKQLYPGDPPPPAIAAKSSLLMPGRSRTWRHAVPTPGGFEVPGRVTLTALIPGPEGTDPMVAEAAFDWRDTPDRCLMYRIGHDPSQAAMIEPFRHAILDVMQEHALFGKVDECVAGGDPTAKLLLFSKALHDRKGVAAAWEALNDAPDEVRCVRNWLLLSADSDRNALAASERDLIQNGLQENDFFADDLTRSLAGK